MSEDFFAGFDTQSFAVDVPALCPPKVRDELARLVARLAELEAEVARLRAHNEAISEAHAELTAERIRLINERDAALARAEAAEAKAERTSLSIRDVVQARDEWHRRADAAERERDEAGQTLCEAHQHLWTGDRRLPQVARDFVVEVKRTEAALAAERAKRCETEEKS